jgi:hypothetical protein
MTTHHNRTATSAIVRLRSPARRHHWLRSFLADMTAWVATCAAYFKAARRYEELSRLSDAELTRRGLDRKTLAHRACADGERDCRN